MVQVSYPGVYVQEVASGSRTITGVSTSIAMFIGRTERGVMNKPTLLFNYSEFSRKFGTSSAKSELATAVRLFFNNGGTQAYVMRIANGGTQATVTLKNLPAVSQKVLKFVAREVGLRGGEIRIAVDYKTVNPDSTFNLRIFRVDPATLQESEVEVHSNLSMLESEARFVVNVIAQNSALVTVTKEIAASTAAGVVIAGRVLKVDSETTPQDILDALVSDGPWRLRIQRDDLEPDVFDVIPGFDLTTELTDYTVTYPEVEASLSFLLQIAGGAGESVRVLPSGTSKDFGVLLQLRPELGGIEQLPASEQRPAPSGVFSKYAPNLAAIAALDQPAAQLLTVGVAPAFGPYDLRTQDTDGKYYDGDASSVPSLRNVRERLERLATSFNQDAINTADFPWRLEVQGLHFVFHPTTGNFNAGSGTTVAAPALITGSTYVMDSTNGRYYGLLDGGEGHQVDGGNGSEGTAPQITDYAAAYEVIRRDVDLFNILILPRDVDILDSERRTFWGPASVFCQERRAFLLIDPPEDWKSIADITSGPNSIGTLRVGVVKDHAAVNFPRILTTVDGFVKPVDPSGPIAGIMARIDANRGVWKAPAGIEADVRAINGVERQVSDPENGVTNSLAINTVRVFPNGIVVWGARTMDGFDNSGNDDYKYVPVRRLALFIAESLARGLKFAVFEPNDEPLWGQIRLAAGSFMNNLFRQGAFQGQKKSDAYFVKVDNETTTQNDINLGIVNVVVGFAPLKPAEFVVVTIQQIAGQVQI